MRAKTEKRSDEDIGARRRRLVRQTRIKIEMTLRRWYPPGYEYRKEVMMAGLLLGMGIGLNLHFIPALHYAVDDLYMHNVYVEGELIRMLMDWREAASFVELTRGYWGYYMPLFLFMAAMSVYHFFYYCHETKSIYLMRRLPKRRVLLMSCIRGPLFWWLMAAVIAAAMYLLYFGLYFWAMPAECLPRFA